MTTPPQEDTDTKKNMKSLFSDAEHMRIDRSMRELEWSCFLAKNVHQEMDKIRHGMYACAWGAFVAGTVMYSTRHPLLSAICGISMSAYGVATVPKRSSSYLAYADLERDARDMREFKMYEGIMDFRRTDVDRLFDRKLELDKNSYATFVYMWDRAKIRLADHKKALLG